MNDHQSAALVGIGVLLAVGVQCALCAVLLFILTAALIKWVQFVAWLIGA